MVIPLRSGRQNHPLGLGELSQTWSGSSGVAARPSRRHHRSPASASSRRGRIPDKQSSQDDDTTARFAAECQSFLRPSSMRGLITVWLPVRVLPAPPRSPALTPSSPSPRNTLDFPRFGAGVMARSRSLRETKTVPEADWGPSSLASEIRFPVRGEGPGQRLGSLRQRPVCMQEIRGPSALQTDADRGLKLPPPAAYGIREGISERLQVVTPDLIGCGGRPHWSGERPF